MTAAGTDDAFFDDDPRHLDRFGALLVLTVIAVAVNMLFDIEDPTESSINELAWIVVTIITGATLMLCANASGVAPRWRRVVFVFVVIVVGGAIVVSVMSASGVDLGAFSGRPTVAWAVIAALSPLFVLRRIFHHERVTGQTIAGALSVFLLIGLAFSYLFGVVDQYGDLFCGTAEPTTSFMYFSLVTLTTLGYGDLNPVTDLARLLSTTEAVLGQVFLVTIVARLVSLYGTEQTLRTAPAQDGDYGKGESAP